MSFWTSALTGAAAALILTGAHAKEERADLLAEHMAQRFSRILAEGAEGGPALDKAIDEIDRNLAKKRLKPIERSVAHEIKGRLLLIRDRKVSSLMDEIQLALTVPGIDDYRRRRLTGSISELLLELGAYREALDFAEEWGASFPYGANDAGLMRAEIFAAAGMPEKALAEIGSVNNEEDIRLERSLRLALLLHFERYDEALAALDTFTRDIVGRPVLDAMKAKIIAMKESGASATERLAAVQAFQEEIEEALNAIQPVKRSPPRNFEGCIVPGSPVTAFVRVRFDIREDGSTTNIRVVDTNDPCYNRATIAAVERWRYTPYRVNGEAITRSDVETRVRFEIVG